MLPLSPSLALARPLYLVYPPLYLARLTITQYLLAPVHLSRERELSFELARFDLGCFLGTLRRTRLATRPTFS